MAKQFNKGQREKTEKKPYRIEGSKGVVFHFGYNPLDAVKRTIYKDDANLDLKITECTIEEAQNYLKTDENIQKRIYVSVTNKEFSQLADYANANDIQIGDVIIKAIQKFLKA